MRKILRFGSVEEAIGFNNRSMYTEEADKHGKEINMERKLDENENAETVRSPIAALF